MKESNQKREPTEDLLAKVPIFARLPRKSLKKLSRLCVPRSYPPHTLLTEEGTTGLGLFFILAGRVEIYKGEEENKVSLSVVGPGDILGEMALIDDQPRSASAMTLESMECLLIPRDNFRTLVKKSPDIAWCMVPRLVEIIRIREGQGSTATEGPGAPEAAVGKGAAPTPSEETVAVGSRAAEGAGESDPQFAMRLLRAQYALTMAGVAGLSGTAKVLESFVRHLASETGLEERRSLGQWTRDLPKGFVSALAAAAAEGEKLPEKMVDRFLESWKRG